MWQRAKEAASDAGARAKEATKQTAEKVGDTVVHGVDRLEKAMGTKPEGPELAQERVDAAAEHASTKLHGKAEEAKESGEEHLGQIKEKADKGSQEAHKTYESAKMKFTGSGDDDATPSND